jgi:hypothetical protein
VLLNDTTLRSLIRGFYLSIRVGELLVICKVLLNRGFALSFRKLCIKSL